MCNAYFYSILLSFAVKLTASVSTFLIFVLGVEYSPQKLQMRVLPLAILEKPEGGGVQTPPPPPAGRGLKVYIWYAFDVASNGKSVKCWCGNSEVGVAMATLAIRCTQPMLVRFGLSGIVMSDFHMPACDLCIACLSITIACTCLSHYSCYSHIWCITMIIY